MKTLKITLSLVLMLMLSGYYAVDSKVTVRTATEVPVLAEVSSYSVRVTTNSLNVRTVAGVGAVIGTLGLGKVTSVLGTTTYQGGLWYKIQFGTKIGFIHSFYTRIVTVVKRYDTVVSVDRMYTMIGRLANKDNARIAGFSSEKMAGDYLQTALTGFGLTVTRQWFPTWIKLANGNRGANTTSSNVIAKSKNFDSNKKTVIIMGHYDSVYTPGADDNASGVAMVVELAKYLNTRTDLKVNVMVLLTGAEEGRHHGSLYYASHPIVPLASTALVINMDMVGAGNMYQIYNYATSMQNGYFSKFALSLGKTMGLSTVQSLSSYSDHTSFELRGVPSVTFMNLTSYRYYHTDYDTSSRISKAVLRNISTMVLNAVEEVSRGQ